MTEINYKEMSDEELVSMAGTTTIGTPSGMSAQKAQAELIRRNTEALKESSESEERYSKRVLFLTAVLLAIAGTQFTLELVPHENLNPWVRYVLGLIIFLGILYLTAKAMSKDDW